MFVSVFVRIHHALASKAEDYFKKQHVFKLQTADQAEYLLQTRSVTPLYFSSRTLGAAVLRIIPGGPKKRSEL